MVSVSQPSALGEQIRVSGWLLLRAGEQMTNRFWNCWVGKLLKMAAAHISLLFLLPAVAMPSVVFSLSFILVDFI